MGTSHRSSPNLLRARQGKMEISVESDGDFALQVHYLGKQQDFAVTQGKQKYELGL